MSRFFKPVRRCLTVGTAALLIVGAVAASGFCESGRYVGSGACADCHEVEYENFKKYAKKAHSGESVQIMAGDLTDEEFKECLSCHVTGYGEPGGFVSFEETPELSDAGCEVCHGPGYEHVESGGDPYLIKGELEVSDCETCHNSERVEAFDYKPLLFGGAH